METQLYKINTMFARQNGLPVYFAANQLIETPRAVYLYGRGTLEARTKFNNCFVCGRELTHPGSMKLGIGPICRGQDIRDEVAANMSQDEIDEIVGKRLVEMQVDQWLPKSCILQVLECDDAVQTPTDHKMLNNTKTSKPAKRATQVQYQNTGEAAIKIEFPFDREVLAEVKSIPGRRFHGEGRDKYWTAPRSIEAVEKLLSMDGFEVDQKLVDYLQASKVNVDDMDPNDINLGNGKLRKLFPFQKKGVAFLQAKDGRALIADEMGLGKTVQALAWLALHPAKRPAIIVVPASLKLNWAKEAKQWLNDPKVQILQGTKANTPIIGELIIINYDILSYWGEALAKVKPQVLILDEVHYIKSNQTKRTKAVRKLAKGMPHIIGLSGTPIVNRPVELLNAIRLIDKSIAPNPWQFLHRYCGARHNGYGWDFTGATNTEELHEKLANSIMIRRLKKDVLTDLPDKVRSFVPMELSNAKIYREAEQNFIKFVREHKGAQAAQKASNAQALAEIEGLKQLAVQGKIQAAIDWIADFLEVDGKLVVFATHKFVIDALMSRFSEVAVKVDGSVTGENRQKAVEAFQNNPHFRLFVGNIKAAGVGLTLTASSTVAFLELPWTPGDLTQAEDRVHRIGQKDSVSIHYLLAEGTIEEDIANLIDRKRKVLDSVLDGQKTDEQSLLQQLMEQYR